MKFRTWSIVTLLVILTSAVAAFAIVVAGLVSYPLVVSSSQDVGARNLSQLANVAANAIDQQDSGSGVGQGLIKTLQRESISAYLIPFGSPNLNDLPFNFPQIYVDQLNSGQNISGRVSSIDGEYLLEGRPLSVDGSVILIQPISIAGASAGAIIWRLALALVLGLAIAITLGFFAAQRLARPLRRASTAAMSMASGSRGVDLASTGPKEVDEISTSLNVLDSALTASEARQREFLLSVSHEFRTPLTAVKGYSEAIADGILSGDDVIEAARLISSESARLNRLVSDLLDLARLGAVDFAISEVRIDLQEFTNEVRQVWGYRCQEQQVNLECEIQVKDTFIGDPIRLRQIVDNLAENALRLSPTHGTLAIRIEQLANSLIIEVRDSGPGLSAEDQLVAFEPGALYERYRGVRPVGTGIGLALVGRLATGMGGSASVGLAPEGGARFTVEIPERSAL
jgi:two-component system sensor histidine kinase BaeS